MLHGLERSVLAGPGEAVDAPRVLLREEAFGNHNVEINRQAECSQRDAQHQGLVSQYPAETGRISVVKQLESSVAGAAEPVLLAVFFGFEEFRTHRRRGGERYEHREGHCQAQGDSKLSKYAAQDASHQKYGDEHRDQRGAHGKDRESNLAGSAKSSFERGESLLEIAGDVFDHHDCVVYNEAGRNGERHQREVIDGVTHQVHHAEGANQRHGHNHAGDEGRPSAAEKEEDNQDNHQDG